MEKHSASKKTIVSKSFIIVTVIFSQVFLVNIATAAVLDWENPNKTGKMEPYKFKVTDVLNSQLMTQVVGCTGIVEKVSLALSRFTTSVFDTASKALTEEAKERIVNRVCGGGETGAMAGMASTDAAAGGGNWTEWIEKFIDCNEVITAKKSRSEIAKAYDDAQKEDSQRRMEQCFEGIAFTLAKNQLTSMARYAINWVNTGFGGDPFFVRNTQNLLTNIEREVFERGVNNLLYTDGAYPYSRAFARSFVSNNRLKNSGIDALRDLTSTMANFVTDPESYVNLNELEKSTRAISLFQKDFRYGGWNAWMAFTQNDANNPLGYQMLAQEIIEQERKAKTTEVKEELLQNDGFLSQKRCVKYSQPTTITRKVDATVGQPGQAQTTKTENISINTTPKCVEWETVTPGTIIKDKLAYYLNSPERQLEIADSINEVLNSVFSMLLSKLADQGVFGITAKERPFAYSASNMSDTDINNPILGQGLLGGSGESAYSDGNFSLTKDLGNRFNFNYNKESNLGTWDASQNIATRKNGTTEKLIKGIGPVVVKKVVDDTTGGSYDFTTYPVNVYYEVTKSGKIALFDNGYDAWEVGDRAFWDGEKWQNWKCKAKTPGGVCANPDPSSKHPIAKKGVIQIQQDYKVAAKQLLQNLPMVMPKLGELDYCIPGPNIGWPKNYGDASSAFTDFAYSLSSTYKPGSWFLARDASVFEIAGPGNPVYEGYKKVFDNTPSVWQKVQQTQTWININSLGDIGSVKKDKIEENFKDIINKELENISKNLMSFREKYDEFIGGVYGKDGLIQTQFFYREDQEEPIENTAYLESARVATPILENIYQYDEDIKTLSEEFKENIINTDANLYKLQKIKDDVSKIILAAQARRDERMLKLLNEEAERTGGKILTVAEYKQKYASCLETEDIVFYDDLDIMSDSSTESERCNDGLDNDWDGLIDERDPDCTGYPMTGSGERVVDGDNGGIDWAFGSDGNNNQGGSAFTR
jgi:hypothetical protein